MSGRFRSALIIGLQGIRARKTRTFLSMVSLFLGVLAVVVVQAGAEIAERALLSESELTRGVDGTRQVYLPPSGAVVPIIMDTLSNEEGAVGMLNLQAIIGEPGANPINAGGMPMGLPDGVTIACDPRGGTCAETRAGPQGAAIELSLVALTGDVRSIRPFRPVSGTWLDFTDDPSYAPRIVFNEQAAEAFQQYRVPAEMRIEGATANTTPQVLGVVDDGGYRGPIAYVRADELLTWMPVSSLSSNNGPGVEVVLAPGTDAVEQTLRARLIAAGVPADQLYVEVVNTKKDLGRELAVLRYIFLGMAGLVLLVGVAGILNVGLATVGERVEEFALRRAVGTPRSLLAGIVLAETLLTGLLTAAAAIGVGMFALKVISVVFAGEQPFLQDLTFPWQAGVAGVIAGLVAGVLGGFVPAIRAARIPIATVMRA